MSAEEAWPRVLFITPCAFNAITGGGVTFSNLFRGWPKDRLATVTCDAVPVSHDVCEKFHFVEEDDRRIAAPLRWWNRYREAAASAPAVSGGPATQPASPSPPPGVAPLRRVLQQVRAALPAERGRIGERLAHFADAFAPTVIYTICGDLVTMDLVDRLQRRFQVPLVVHLMDDGVTRPRGTGVFAGRTRRIHGRLMKDLLRRSAVRMGICDAMAREYEARYGGAFESFQNTVDLPAFDAARRPPGPRQDPPRLVYVGSIYPVAQDQSLIEVAEAVEALRRQGTELRLEVHAPEGLFGQYRSRLEIGPNVSFHDAPDDDGRFVELVTGADALVLPVNFDEASVRYIRLSMPTKVPAYLASGTPILVYGPASTAQVAYALESDWGLVVPRREPEPLAEGLKRIVSDLPLRHALAEQAVRTSRERHDATRVRERFRDALTRAARSSG